MFSLTIPKNAVTVGEIIEEEYRKPLGLTQQQLADALGISRRPYAEIAAGKRAVTIDTALRLGRVFSTGPQLWINLQMMYDLSEAQKSPAATEIKKLKPLKLDAKKTLPAESAPRSAASTATGRNCMRDTKPCGKNKGPDSSEPLSYMAPESGLEPETR